MARSQYIYYTHDTRWWTSPRVFTVKREAIAFAEKHRYADVYRARVDEDGAARVTTDPVPSDLQDRVYRHPNQR